MNSQVLPSPQLTGPASSSLKVSSDRSLSSGKTILVADDEPDVLNLVAAHLASAGYKVLRASDGAEALAKAREHLPSVVVLDIMMPEMSGLEVCKALKSDSRTTSISVVMLTARTSEVDRVLSFELGADDYLSKPFSPRELVLRITAIIRRRTPAPQPSGFLRAGDIAIDRDRHDVSIQGCSISLTAIEFRLLLALLENRGRTLSRGNILEIVWGYNSDVETRTVDTHLRRLREKLGAAAKQIQTVRGFGYRLDEG
jgi:two-component system phosphate regulon response regulator PhoB